MKSTVCVAGIQCLPGQKTSEIITIPGTAYRMPFTIINGNEDGKKIFITAGVHGCEYPGIQAAVELSQELDPAKVRGLIVIIPAFNLSALYGRRAYVCPEDEESKNYNHIFPGDRNGTTAERVAAYVSEEIVPMMDLHVDLHSGDITEKLVEFIDVCNSKDPKIVEWCTEICKHTSFTHRINSNGRTEVYNSSAIDRGVPAILFERGGLGQVNRDEIDRDKADLISIMRYIGILPGKPLDNSAGQIFYPRHHWGSAGATGLFYKFADTGDEIRKGQKIGEIRDIFGNVLEEIFAEFDAHIRLSNNTLGIAKGNDTFMYGSIREE